MDCRENLGQGSGVNQEYQIGKTWWMGRVLRVKDEMVPRKALKGIRGREKTSWKAWRKMIRCSGQGCKEDVEKLELEEVSRG